MYNIDCLTGMPMYVEDKSVDLILADLPYGQTQNHWDTVIPFEQLWSQYERVIKPNGAIVLFAQGMFAYKLALSNEKLFRYDLIWHKVGKAVGFLNANRMPLRNHEHILIFYKNLPTYNPQKRKGDPSHPRGPFNQKTHSRGKKQTNNNYGKFDQTHQNVLSEDKYPLSVLHFPAVPPPTLHATQKPQELCEWLIKTYTNEGELVLDNCMGSATTAIACINTGRYYIGFEKDPDIFKVGEKRIRDYKGIFA